MRLIPCLIGFATCGVMTSAAAEDLPHRKPGMWESTMESAQLKGRTVVSQQCIDQKTDLDMQKRAMPENNTSCSQQSSKALPNGWEYFSVCKLSDATLTSHVTLAGDFNSSYVMEINSHREPARNGVADSRTTVHTKYLGACSPDMKPGDMRINGMLIRSDGVPANMTPQQVEQMKKMMEQMKKQR